MHVREVVTWSIGLILTFSLISGCSDNPDRQAAKDIRQKTGEALDSLQGHLNEEKLASADNSLQSALTRRGMGSSKNSAYLTSGNLQLMQARRKTINLALMAVPVTEQIRQIQDYSRRLSQVQLQRGRIEGLLAEGQKEIEDLRQLLDTGTQQLPGLRAQLGDRQARLADLTEQQTQWQQKADTAQREIETLQAKADEALRQAQLVTGSQKESLEKTGYDLLMQKKSFYLEKQEALDQVGLLGSQMDLIRPIIAHLEEDIAQTQQKIAHYEQSPQRQQLLALKKDLEDEEAREKQNVLQQISELKQYADAYRNASEELGSEVQAMIESYGQVRSRESQPMLDYKTAQGHALLGSIVAARLYFESDLGVAIESLMQTADAEIRPPLQEALAVVAEDELLKQAVEHFDQADEAFEMALSGGSLGEPFQIDVTRSRLLAMDEKMRLADRLDRYQLAESTQTRLDELRQKAAEEFGPDFTLSETAQLLEKGLDYIPQVPFNSELFFESVKPQLTAWRTKRGPEREQTALEALEMIKQLEVRADATLLRLLEPERRAIEQAMEQGFPEEEVAPSGDMGMGMGMPSEPNGFGM